MGKCLLDIPDYTLVSLGEKVITAYSSCPTETDSTPFITASQKQVGDGIIACPRDIPFGSKVVVNGKTYICEDRMSERYDCSPGLEKTCIEERFDIWFPDKISAINFGKKTLIVYLKTN